MLGSVGARSPGRRTATWLRAVEQAREAREQHSGGGECVHPQAGQEPWWAALMMWGVVNAVNVLQTVGFLSRIRSGTMTLNHRLGYVMIALAAPALVALVAFVESRAGVVLSLGPVVYVLFVALMLAVDYVAPLEFRSPPRYGILVPYLVLFFAAILLMGLPMFTLNRSYWLVTVATSVLLLMSMVVALRKGVG